MTAHPPPIPPAQRAPHEGAEPNGTGQNAKNKGVAGPTENVAQNTHNKGHQQDR